MSSQKLKTLIPLLLVIGVGAVIVGYYLTRPRRLVCEAGFVSDAVQYGRTRVRCSNPMFDIVCVKGSFGFLDGLMSCLSGSDEKFSIENNSLENDGQCRQSHGELSLATGKDTCSCKEGAEMRSNRCVDLTEERREKVKAEFSEQNNKCLSKYGPNVHANKNAGQWDCQCDAGYMFVSQEEQCVVTKDACPKLFGPNARVSNYGPSRCQCPLPFMWNKERTECVVPPY